MNEKVRKQALAKSQKALDLIAQSSLSKADQDQVVKETVANFNTYVNPSILEIRKSCANENSDYQSVEWDDSDDTFKDVHGREFIDCLAGSASSPSVTATRPSSRPSPTSSSARRCIRRRSLTRCAAISASCWRSSRRVT